MPRTKAKVFFDFCADLMGAESQATPRLARGNLYPEQLYLDQLIELVYSSEIENTIEKLPNGKSPGPRGGRRICVRGGGGQKSYSNN